MAREKKQSISLQTIVGTVIVLIITGVLGWGGSVINKTIEDVQDLKEWRAGIQVTIDKTIIEDLEELIEDFENYKKENASRLGTLQGEDKQLSVLTARLQGVVEEMKRRLE